MTKREKTILWLCGVVAIGACLFHALDLSKKTASGSEAGQSDFSSLILKAKASISEGELTDREKRVLELASGQLLGDPLRSRPLLPYGDDSAPVIPLPNYIGFINTGHHPIAIIDGRDYRAGELVLGGEFEVSQIKADHIRLLRRGASETVKVPIEKPQVP